MEMQIMKYLSFFLILMLIAGCAADNGTDPVDDDVAEIVASGWETFGYAVLGGGSFSYQNALETFEEAIGLDSSSAESFHGAGWCSARLTLLSQAVSFFQQSIAINSDLTSAHAGLAFVYNAQKQYQNSNSEALIVINQDSEWNFDHDNSLSYTDIYVMIAMNYYALGNYSQSLTYVKKLNPEFNISVDTLEGKSALAEEIERLRGTV